MVDDACSGGRLYRGPALLQIYSARVFVDKVKSGELVMVGRLSALPSLIFRGQTNLSWLLPERTVLTTTSAVQMKVSGPKVPLVVSAVRSPTEQVTAAVGLRLSRDCFENEQRSKIRYDYSGFSRKAFTLEY